MKTKLLILVVLLSTQFIIAQNYQTIEEIDDACTQLGFSGDDDAEIIVDNILEKIGLFKNFTIQECPNINNAVAKNIDIGNGRKERFILYDNEFFNKIEDKASNDWAGISILAHEIGHHLNGHSLNNDGSTHQYELEADEFSGFVLARMGSSLEDAQSAINTLKYEKATRTHPAKADRLVAIERGWYRGNGKTIEVTTVVEVEDDKVIVVDEPKEEVVIINEDISDGKLGAEKVLLNYINAIGGQEKIVGIKTMIRNFNSTSVAVYDKKKTISNSSTNTKYLTPSKYISSTEIESTGQSVKSMFLDAKFYIQKSSGQWGMSENKAILDAMVGSYVPEYLYLVNNADLKLNGIKKIKGKKYYAVALPETSSASDMGTFKSITNSAVVHFYSVETGLLHMSETTTDTEIDYLENNQYLKDSKTKYVMPTLYSDYREVGGLLFSFKQVMDFEMDIAGKIYRTETTIEYSDILLNPNIDSSEFTIENKEVFNQDDYTKNIMEAAQLYSKGVQLITKQSCSEGVESIKKAANLGSDYAQNMLGELYDNSYSFCKKALKKDYDQALIWYSKAADQGQQAALKKMAQIYEKGDYGVNKSKETAFRYYIKSTRSLVWNMVDPNTFESINKLKKSIDLNENELEYINALNHMSNGKKTKSKKSLLLSAEGGNVDAQVALGYVFLMEQNMKKRSKWLKKAMEQGDKEAIKLLNQF
ncbi:MAG: TPR repeat protein [Flavobacteriales bacterium]|jgi:TPR repeat protein